MFTSTYQQKGKVIPVRGTIRKAHYVALISMILCLVVATAATQAQAASQRSSLNIRQLNVVKTFTTVKFTVATNVATQLVINTGTDKVYMVSTSDRSKLKHAVTVRGLAPNTNYYYTLVLTPKTGKTRTVRGVFKTAAPGSSPATVTTRGNKLLLNGSAFFPIIADSYACPKLKDVTADLAMGFNVIDGPNGCGSDPTSEMRDAQFLHDLLNNEAWYLPTNPYLPVAAGLQTLPELLSWPGGVNPQTVLPNGSCSIPAYDKQVGKLYASLAHTASLKPVVFLADFSTFPNQGRANCYNSSSAYALLWALKDAGAQSVQLTTTPHWNSDAGVSTSAAVASATAKFTKELATLGTVIFYGKRLDIPVNIKGTVEVTAWEYNGATYVIVVNIGTVSASQTTAVPGLASAKTAQVLWENRSVKVVAGSITDNYPMSAPVHIYRISTKK